MSDGEFAYGSDGVLDCECPAASAGYSPSKRDVSAPVADEFDWLIWQDDAIERLRDDDHDHSSRGIISEDDAQRIWFKAIDHVKETHGDGEEVRAGEEIADELGWSR